MLTVETVSTNIYELAIGYGKVVAVWEKAISESGTLKYVSENKL